MEPDIKGIKLLDRPHEMRPIAENAEELKELKEEVKRISYSDLVLKETKDLPNNTKELRERLDRRAEHLASSGSHAEKEHQKNVPQMSLRNLEDERAWERMGWNEEDRTKVKQKLKERLQFDDSKKEDAARIDNTMHMLIASGKTAQEVLTVLNDDANWNYYTNEEAGVARMQSMFGEEGMLAQLGVRDPLTAQKYLYLTEKLGLTNRTNTMNDVYIRRFVLDNEFRRSLDNEYDQQLPQNLFDLAWNIGYHEPKYGIGGEFPVLQMQVNTDPATGRAKEGRYVVNQGNIVRWLRERMYTRWDVFETDEQIDFYSLIHIHKGQYATINLATIIFDKDRYFTDETGHEWEGLYNQLFIEPWMLLWERLYAVQYNNSSDTEEDLVKAMQSWSTLSKFTRKVGGMSMPDRSLSAPLDFTGRDSDTKVGEAMLQMYLMYYNLADYKKLKDLLGENAQFFDRDAWIDAAAQFTENGIFPSTGAVPNIEGFFGSREQYFEKAFDKETGKVTEATKANFIKFINMYTQEQRPQQLVKALDQMVKNTVRDKFKSKENKDKNGEYLVDTSSLDYAWLKAHSWTFFTGVLARNNHPDVWGFPETRWMYPYAYRLKYEGYGGAGNPYTVPQFKKLDLPFFEAILSENGNERYVTYDENGKATLKPRQLAAMEIMLKMQAKSAEFDKLRKGLENQLKNATSDEEKARIQKEIARIEDIGKNYYKILCGQLEFNDNAMRIYAKNVVAKGKAVYEQIMKGEETAFEKFVVYDGLFRGPTFKRAEWQASLQSKLITPLRYVFDANGATQLNMWVREPAYVGRDKDGKPKWEWRDMQLGEAMMGHEILDIPTFRKRVSDVGPQEWQDMKRRGYRKRGKYIIRPDGKHDIDYNKVQDNKPMVWKQWMLMKIAGDLWSHIDSHSTDPAYTLAHYDDIVDAIAQLPGDISGDEFNMKGVRTSKTFFTKEQIKWLKRKSGAEQLFIRELIKAVAMGDPRKKDSLFGDSVGILVGGIFRGYH